MNEYEEKYKKIVINLVKKSFPELRRHKIYIKESKRIFGGRMSYFFFFSFIIIGARLKYSYKEITGILSHELSHIMIFRKEGILKSLFKGFLAQFPSNYRKELERATDIEAIKRGYGRELYAARKKNLLKADKKTKKRITKYYLSLDEIKQLMRKK